MKRDPDLIRALILRLEDYPQRYGAVTFFKHGDPDIAIEGYEADQIGYHARLLADAGYIKEPDARPMSGFGFSGLTWAGHDFADSVVIPRFGARRKAVLRLPAVGRSTC